MHQVYLSLGSNIQPEPNLLKALKLLNENGEIRKVSHAWESEAVGSDGPNFLNSCVLFLTSLLEAELKEQVIHPIEEKLGRKRSADKYAPRTIDIDIVLFDDQLCNDKFWKQAFVVVPLAEIYPEYRNQQTQERILEAATRLRQQVWMEMRPEVLSQLDGSSFKAQS
ncbi:MAG TPA: 2-amino-4-hydroxy-6-hydroxymethyldihydropteridine diphosphokinase [Anaerolineales bacterium]|nr:2-amino-4-hydroxy-6-hydroxymethyldihydropteridine diphosphokinase [Anaerolineales bacterium]